MGNRGVKETRENTNPPFFLSPLHYLTRGDDAVRLKLVCPRTKGNVFVFLGLRHRVRKTPPAVSHAFDTIAVEINQKAISAPQRAGDQKRGTHARTHARARAQRTWRSTASR